MSDITELTQKIVQFRDERNWAQFHTGKDLAINLNVESAELLELFLWKNSDDVDLAKMKLELADVIYSALLLAHTYKIDVKEIVFEKLRINETKYPVEKARDSNKKYDQL